MIQGYQVTADDWLWLLRSVQAEGPPSVAVARAMVNLWALARSRGSKQSIADLVRKYSQPVNPKHAQGGALDADTSVTSVAEKRRATASVATTFSPAVALAVSRALTSGYEGDVTDFAAWWHDASKKYSPRSDPKKGENRLWSRQPGWGGYRVDAMTNSERVAAIRSMAKALPANEREHVEGALVSVLARYPTIGADGGLLDGVRVIRPGDPGYDAARATAAAPIESDLALANWLDGVYGVTSARVHELGASAVDAAEAVAKPVSTLIWAVTALLLVWWVSKER